MSGVSSASRRPFGNPAMSPPSSPSGPVLAGAMPMLSRIISAGFTFLGWFSPGMPVRKMLAMSLRGAAGT